MLELPLALAVVVGGALGLSRAGGATVFPATSDIFFTIFTAKISSKTTKKKVIVGHKYIILTVEADKKAQTQKNHNNH